MSETTPPPGDQQLLGLRARKKALTHRTIAEAAFALTLEHGLDAVTIDQIAERAFVSPRTVSNYFPSKEAAIVAADDVALLDLIAGLEARPGDEAPLQSLHAVLTSSIRSWSKEQLRSLKAKEDLVEANPALLPYRTAQFDELEDAIRIVIAKRAGSDPEIAPFPRLIAGAATAAVKTAIKVWVNTNGGVDRIAEIVEQAFGDLEAGLSPGA